MSTNATAISPASEAASRYQRDGYVVFPGLVSPERIDTVLGLYQKQIHSSSHKFFRQNTNRYEANELNSHGYVRQSFLDVHAYRSYPEFQEATLEIYFAPEMHRALAEITGHARHNLMQSMLFDLNAATTPHQDWWYLDSVSPAGGLLAAWIALEDITEEAGRFYVLPGSQNTVLHEEGMPHSDWLDRMRAHLKAHRSELHVPALKKGDVLFWNSRTIHGALETQNESHSRKSLTAHYLPADLTFGNLFTAKSWVQYTEWRGHHYFANQPEYSLKADLISRAKVAVYDHPTLLKLARKFQKSSISDS